MAIANNAEFLAPAFPIAKVATGTPAASAQSNKGCPHHLLHSALVHLEQV